LVRDLWLCLKLVHQTCLPALFVSLSSSRTSSRFCPRSYTFHHVHHPTVYTLISFQSLNHHLYADDTQLFFSFYPRDLHSSISHLQDALQQISSWMTANLLTLNCSKTLITITRPPYLPLSKSQIALSIMHHPVFGIIFLLHSVNLVHHLSPPSHRPSLPISSIPDLKLTCSTNPSHHKSSPIHRIAHWTSTGLPSRTPYHSA